MKRFTMAQFDRCLGAGIVRGNGTMISSRYSTKKFRLTLFLGKNSVRQIFNSPPYTEARALGPAIRDDSWALFLNAQQRMLLCRWKSGSWLAAVFAVIRKSHSLCMEEMIHLFQGK